MWQKAEPGLWALGDYIANGIQSGCPRDRDKEVMILWILLSTLIYGRTLIGPNNLGGGHTPQKWPSQPSACWLSEAATTQFPLHPTGRVSKAQRACVQRDHMAYLNQWHWLASSYYEGLNVSSIPILRPRHESAKAAPYPAYPNTVRRHQARLLNRCDIDYLNLYRFLSLLDLFTSR